MYSLLLLPLWVVLNRLRGGGWPALTDPLPTRALWFCGAVMGLSIWPISDWRFALTVWLGYALSMLVGWGLWFDLGRDGPRLNDSRHKDLFVRFIHAISFGSDHLALFWRHFIFIWPLFGSLVLWLGYPPALFLGTGAYAAAVVCAYEVGHRFGRGTGTGEFLTGGIWWLMITLLL